MKKITIKLIVDYIYTQYKKRRIINWGGRGLVRFPLYITGAKYIRIGTSFTCRKRTRLEAINLESNDTEVPLIIIGNNVSINWDCHIGAINKIIIEDNVLIGSKVLIIDHQHGEINAQSIQLPPAQRNLWSKGPIIIKKNVWIGEGACIMPNVIIGNNSIIGANSVVTKNVPADCVVAGNPAKIIKYLN